MAEQTYKISQVNKHVFEFPSVGKKHLVKQVSLDEIEPGIYNMALGTVLDNGTVNFQDSSNNGDVVKVFSTAISCISIFVSGFPDRFIFFRGNTEQKTRVYNEILRRHYNEFSKKFNIFGMSIKDGRTTIQKFDVSGNYSGFYLSVRI